MNLTEFEHIWHDWLRGIALIALLIVLVVLYFSRLLSEPAYACLLTVVLLLAGAVAVVGTGFERRISLWAHLVTLMVVAPGGLLLFVTLHQQLYPPRPYAEATISRIQATATLVVPTTGLDDSYLTLYGRPGASPTGKDREVSVLLELCGEDLDHSVDVTLFSNKGPAGGKSKGLSLGRKESDQFLLAGVAEGPLEVRVLEWKPEGTLPLRLALFRPLFPPPLVQWALHLLALLSLVLAVFVARRGSLPTVLPYAMVVDGVNLLVARGISPTQPLLPLLGIAIGVGLVGSAAGYLLARLLQRRLSRPGSVAS